MERIEMPAELNDNNKRWNFKVKLFILDLIT